MEYTDIWSAMLQRAKSVLRPRRLADMDIGGVAAAIQSGTGRIYVGVCIDTACSLGMCAERNAAANLLTNGESIVKRIVTIGENGIMPPCGVCREFLMQMGENAGEIEVMLSDSPRRIVQLKELLPEWWQ